MAAWTEAFVGSATIGSTQYSCPNASTTLTPRTDKATYQIFLDTAAIIAGDQFEIRILEKCRTGSTQRRLMSAILTGAMADSWQSPALMLGNGWDVTLQKLAGTDRAIEWSIRAYQ
jgi:hypothetical protein